MSNAPPRRLALRAYAQPFAAALFLLAGGGYWVHGVDNLRDYLRAAQDYTLEGRIERIECPTLVTLAEGDPLAANTPGVFDALRCPKTLIRFTAAEGAAGHVEMSNRSLLNRRVLDWLDERFREKRP